MNAGDAIHEKEEKKEEAEPVEVEHIKMAQSEIVSPFKEIKEKIKTLCKSSRFSESLDLIKTYLKENSLEEASLEERSKVYLRYLIVVQKLQNLKLVGEVYINYIKPTLANSTESATARARMLYALQRISTALQFKDQLTPCLEI